MQTFPLPLCQGIRGFSVTKQKKLWGQTPQKPPKGARGTLYTRSARLFSHAENAGAAEFVLTQSSFSHGHLRPLNQVKCRSRTENNGKQIRFEMA